MNNNGDKDWCIPYTIFLVAVASIAVIPSDVSACTAASESITAHFTFGWCAEYWINRYQALLAGLLALLGAAVTVRVIRAQIRQANEIEEGHRVREENAALAVLPLALSSLYEYGRRCIGLLIMYKDDINQENRQYIDQHYKFPELPQYVVPELKTTVRYASPERAVEVAKLLAFLQVQQSRLRDSKFRWDSLDRDDRIFEAAQLSAMVNRLFPYSRGQPDDGVKSLTEEIGNVFRIENISTDEFPRLFGRLRNQ